MSKPLVTIFTGNSNSGSACIRELIDRYQDNVRIRAVFRSEEKAEPFKQTGIEIVTGCDANQIETLDKAFKGAKYALIVTPHDPKRGINDDARLTENMINSAVANNIEYIVLVASWTVHYPKEISHLSSRFIGSEKLLEKHGQEKGLKWTVLRGGVFMENMIGNIKDAVGTSVFRYPEILCPYIDTKDIGRSAAACLAGNVDGHNQKCYEMNGPERYNGQRIAEIIGKVFDKKVSYEPVPKEACQKFMPEPIYQVFEFMMRDSSCIPFNDDVKKLTGKWSSFEDFVRDHVNEIFQC